MRIDALKILQNFTTLPDCMDYFVPSWIWSGPTMHFSPTASPQGDVAMQRQRYYANHFYWEDSYPGEYGTVLYPLEFQLRRACLYRQPQWVPGES